MIKTKYKLKSSANISTIIKKRIKYIEDFHRQIGSPLSKSSKCGKFEPVDQAFGNFYD